MTTATRAAVGPVGSGSRRHPAAASPAGTGVPSAPGSRPGPVRTSVGSSPHTVTWPSLRPGRARLP